jgi:hypothetical protein
MSCEVMPLLTQGTRPRQQVVERLACECSQKRIRFFTGRSINLIAAAQIARPDEEPVVISGHRLQFSSEHHLRTLPVVHSREALSAVCHYGSFELMRGAATENS